MGSKSEIYDLIAEAQSLGLAVLLVSSDFEEVKGICNRALVFNRGHVSVELTGDSLTVAGLTECASAPTRPPTG